MADVIADSNVVLAYRNSRDQYHDRRRRSWKRSTTATFPAAS